MGNTILGNHSALPWASNSSKGGNNVLSRSNVRSFKGLSIVIVLTRKGRILIIFRAFSTGLQEVIN